MNVETSYIERTVHVNPIGKLEGFSYKWIGDSPYVYIDFYVMETEGLREKNLISIGGHKLLFVEIDYMRGSYLFVRKDKLGAMRIFLHKASRFLDLAYRRFIITLAVWNLAKYHEGKIPSWRDIRIFKK